MKKIFLYARLGIISILNKISTKMRIKRSLEHALVYERLGNAFRAGRIFSKIINTYPKDPRGYYGMAMLYDNKGKYSKAIAWYNKSIEADLHFIPAWFFLANALYETGEKILSIECYKNVIQLDPENFWAYNNAGSIYEELDMNTEALKYFRKALEIIPGHHKALFNMGVVYSRMGYEKKAQEYYWESIRGNNKYPYSFLNLSLLYKKEDKLDRAIVVISEGIRCNPDASFLYYNRACLLAISGYVDEAFMDVARAAKLNPSYYGYAEKDDELANVRMHPGFKALKKAISSERISDE